MSKTLEQWAEEIYQWAERKGWNKDIDVRGELMNFHAEISEAWEEWRKGIQGNEVYFSASEVGSVGDYEVLRAARCGVKPEGFVIEVADLVIRILHSMKYHGWDLEKAIEVKMAYNETREYRHGGKRA